ncbi:type II toxin-antitoxin system HipA family toxin [Antrihabitans sp. NCIMB 15449]|uniref:Type II toxin-antitoxin system HipA family toxin n=1 Tax=Antrihabitans spumae TaxID=3373370 RepID=A0ABW7JW61_9NOCA
MTAADMLKSIDRADVYKGETLAGQLIREDSDVVFRYREDYAESELPDLAWTIPKSSNEFRATGGSLPPFFAGLLPEGVRLQGVVAGTKTSVDDHMTLLLAVGADTIGDVRVLPAGEEAPAARPAFDPERVRALDLGEVFAAVSGPDALELDPAALPGVQAKVSAVMYSTPLTTKSGPAILKLAPAQGYPQLVENEHFFMSLAVDCGLTVPRHQIVHDRHDRPGLLVSRFDRSSGSSIAQEDACQVMAMYPAAKYRMKTEEIVGALSSVCERGDGSARAATLDVLRLVAYSYAIGNGDLHGKNFSVFASKAGVWTVTPAYDLLCTQPYLSWRDPMALDFYGRANKLTRQHFVESARRLGLPERALTRMLDQVCSGVLAGAEKVDDIGFVDKDTSRLRELLMHRVDELRS